MLKRFGVPSSGEVLSRGSMTRDYGGPSGRKKDGKAKLFRGLKLKMVQVSKAPQVLSVPRQYDWSLVFDYLKII